MADFKTIGIGVLINIVLTIILSIIMFPLFFLGPVIGGFISTYIAQDTSRYYTKNQIPVAFERAITGIIGGLIIGIILISAFWIISTFIGHIFIQIGSITGTLTLLTGMLITFISIIIGGVLGAIGGVIGFSAKEKGLLMD